MLTIRCTTKLLKRMRVPDAPPTPTPDPRLGDWYATVLQMRPQHLVLLVNERTRLAVVLPVRDFLAPGANIAGAIAHVLADLGVEAGVVEAERLAMAAVSFARPSSRNISETMNELALQLEELRERNPNLADHALSMKLGQFPVSIPGLGSRRPAELARQALDLPDGEGRSGGGSGRE
jgi:hypothetical protein